MSSKRFAKLTSRLRRRVRHALARKAKSKGTLKLLGCDGETLMKHLESLFKPGMSWLNRGSVWHIDHIRPCATFDLLKVSEQRKCFHYTNLQPLFAKENLKKGKKWERKQELKLK